MTIEELEAMKAALEADIDKLEFKRAVLEGTVELLGKGQGADPRMLANREKAILVESLRPAHKLKDRSTWRALPGQAAATRWRRWPNLTSTPTSASASARYPTRFAGATGTDASTPC